MTTAIVLSGGGSRGDFQLGAITALYEAGIRPDIICATSVGALNALMLTQGDSGLDDLRKIWFGLRRNDHMWLFEDWWEEVDPNLRKVIIGSMMGDPADGEPAAVALGSITGGTLGALLGPVGILMGAFVGAAVSGNTNNVVADAFTGNAIRRMLVLLSTRSRALLNLNPIRAIMDERFDIAKLNQFVGAGKQLRFATVGLESGELCYVTETGDLLRRDGNQRIAAGISILDAAMASSAIAAVFPPVNFAGDAWIDGGHRENVPLRAAIQAGATQIFVVNTGPIDRWSAVNRTPDALFDRPPPTDFESRRILDIANRALLEIHLDEMAADDVYPILDSANLPITLIAPEYPSHDIVTIDPELIRVNYDYGYRSAWDALNNAPSALRDYSTQIALNHGRASRLRKVTWRGIGTPFAAEINTLMNNARAASEARSAQGARNAGPGVSVASSQGHDMLPGELMLPGQSISSPDGRFVLIHQTDGHLVIYRASGGNPFAEATWASGQFGFSPGVCVMQRDGNLVIYDADLMPRWASGTDGNPDIALRLQNDGDLVLHRADQVIWRTGAPVPDVTPVVRVVIIVNASPANLTVRFYNVSDGVMAVTLPDGTQTISTGSSIAWPLPSGFQDVKVTFNGRNARTVNAGETVTYSTDERVRVLNQSPRAITVRIFRDTDLVRFVALPGGEFSIPAGGEASWEMPQDVDRAAVVMNNRQVEMVMRGSVITYAQDDRILVRNLSGVPVIARFYNINDGVRWFTLPGGDISLPGNEERYFNVPADLATVQVILADQRMNAVDIGETLIVNPDGSITRG